MKTTVPTQRAGKKKKKTDYSCCNFTGKRVGRKKILLPWPSEC
jgi:hypothetical protein